MPDPKSADDLTHLAKHKLRGNGATIRNYFGRMRDRMTALGWPADDRIFVSASAAFDAAEAFVRSIYAPTGELPKPDPSDFPLPPPREGEPKWVGKGSSRRRRHR